MYEQLNKVCGDILQEVPEDRRRFVELIFWTGAYNVATNLGAAALEAEKDIRSRMEQLCSLRVDHKNKKEPQ